MSAGGPRQLVVIADDYGIGPRTSAGILELAQQGIVTGSVLLVNSPYAEAEVSHWDKAGRPMELGWHPNLTLDAPVLPARRVPSLVNAQGRFWPLGTFMKRLFFGRINPAEVADEFRAQLKRFISLVGRPPRLLNSHQHISIFAPIGQILLDVLRQSNERPYVRRVREPWNVIWRIRGARKKRTFLNFHGRAMSRRQEALGFPGNDWLGGITDPPWVKRATFFEDWLQAFPGKPPLAKGGLGGSVVELSCHPGHFDETLVGRDCTASDGMLGRRVDELALLRRPEFLGAVAESGFEIVNPVQLLENGVAHAA